MNVAQYNSPFCTILPGLLHTTSKYSTLFDYLYGSKDHVCQAVMVQSPSDLHATMTYANKTDSLLWFCRALGSRSGGTSSGILRKLP